MKFRLTPLNIVTALSLSLLIVLFFQPAPKVPSHLNVNAINQMLLGALVLVTFICDLIFRFALKDLKRIWLVEIIFIVIAVVTFLILQK